MNPQLRKLEILCLYNLHTSPVLNALNHTNCQLMNMVRSREREVLDNQCSSASCFLSSNLSCDCKYNNLVVTNVCTYKVESAETTTHVHEIS